MGGWIGRSIFGNRPDISRRGWPQWVGLGRIGISVVTDEKVRVGDGPKGLLGYVGLSSATDQ